MDRLDRVECADRPTICRRIAPVLSLRTALAAVGRVSGAEWDVEMAYRAPTDETLTISAALRGDEPVLDRALSHLAAVPADADASWLAMEIARYLQREARRRHPGVDVVFEALELEGDLAVVAQKVSVRLRELLLSRRHDVQRWNRRQAQERADAELLAAALADLQAALKVPALFARLAAKSARTCTVAAVDARIFDDPQALGLRLGR